MAEQVAVNSGSGNGGSSVASTVKAPKPKLNSSRATQRVATIYGSSFICLPRGPTEFLPGPHPLS